MSLDLILLSPGTRVKRIGVSSAVTSGRTRGFSEVRGRELRGILNLRQVSVFARPKESWRSVN